MANIATVSTKGLYGTADDRIVAVSTKGLYGTLAEILAVVAIMRAVLDVVVSIDDVRFEDVVGSQDNDKVINIIARFES